MGQVLVRNIDDDVIETFKMRARRNGTSLEQEIRDLIYSKRKLTPEEKLAVSRELRSQTKGLVPPLSAEERREGLE